MYNISQTNKEEPEREPSSDDNNKFVIYPYRWWVLIMVFLLNTSNQIIWISYSPISFISSTYYDISLTGINMLSAIYSILYVPLGFTSSWILDTRGLKTGVMAGIWLNIIGAWFRYISCFFGSPHGRYAGAFIGQFICSCAQPFLMNSPTKLAANWFPTNQRATANMLCSISPAIGVAIGSVIPPFVVSSPSDMPTLMLITAVIAAVFGVISAIFMRDRPPTPPSASALSTAFDPFMVGVKKVFKIPAFLYLTISFGLGVGLFNGLATVFAQVIAPQGYTADDAGTLTGVMIGAGLFGAVVTAPIIDKWHKYKETYSVTFCIYIAAALSLVFFTLSIRPNMFGLLAAATICLGMFAFSILAVAFELGVEASYPVAEGTSAGFLWMIGQVVSVVFIFAANGFQDETNVCWLYTAAAILGAIISLFIKTEYHRLKAEHAMLLASKSKSSENEEKQAL